jgi:hypothetical protein
VKKQLSILVLILIINIPFIGFYSVFHLQKLKIENHIKVEIQNGINTTELVSLQFSREQIKSCLNWLSKREFKYNGMVYEVINVKYSGNEIIYSCYKNQEAAQLIRNFENIVNLKMQNDKDTQTAAVNLTNFFQSLFIEILKSDMPAILNSNFVKNYHYYDDIILRYSKTLEHPPKFIS